MLEKNEFEALYNKYVDEVAAFLYSYASNKAQLKDWIQEIFIKLWQLRSQINFHHPGFKGYLFTTARNHALAKLRKQKKYDNWLEQNLIRLTQTQPSDLPAINPRDSKKMYQQALSKIPSRACQAYLLSREEGLTYEEIACEMNISVKTVEAHLSKALQILRAELVK